MGGPSGAQQAQQQGIANTQLGIANQQQGIAGGLSAFGQSQIGQGAALEQPLIAKLTAEASGDPQALLSAEAVPIGNVAAGYQAAKDNIYNTIAPGAARDYSLAQLERGKATQNATLLNQAYQGAAPALAQVGAANIGTGLQAQGGAISGLNAATGSTSAAESTVNNIIQQQEQAKSSSMSFLGSLIGAGAGAATGGLFGGVGGLFGGGGGNSSPSAPPGFQFYNQARPFNVGSINPGIPEPPAGIF